MLLLFLCLFCCAGCDYDDSRFSSSQIQRALFDMKGTCHGTVQVAYYQGGDIAGSAGAVAVSPDSLSFAVSLLPMAELVTDESIAQLLREIGEVAVTARYDFIQMDEGHIHFGLHPKEVVIPGGYGVTSIKNVL